MKASRLLFFAVLLVVATAAPAGAAGHWTAETVASGLDNPRGVDVGSNGSVYVAESGSGGATLVEATIGGEPAFGCVGDTGAITRIDRKGAAHRVATLPSLAEAFDADGPGPTEPTCEGPVGFAAVGPSNVALLGNGTLSVAMGLGGDEALQDVLGDAFGSLHGVRPNGKTRFLGNVTAYEEANDPDSEGSDSNPYGVAHVAGGRLVADAGANALFHVANNGTISTVAVFPRLAPTPFVPPSCAGELPFPLPPPGTPIPPQSVPTSVAVGPDGAYYVGILTGFPFPVGEAKVYRVDPATGDVTVHADGLTHVTGIDFGPDGALYVAQMTDLSLLELELCGGDTPGSVLRIHDGGVETIAMLPLVGDVAVAADGAVYVTTGSILPAFAGGGSLVKLTP